MAKNEEKPCSTGLQDIFRPILGTHKLDFGYPLAATIFNVILLAEGFTYVLQPKVQDGAKYG